MTFFYTAKKASPFYPAGHALGFDELILSEEPFFLDAPVEEGALQVEAGPRQVVFTGEDFRYVFDNRTGLFSQMVYKNRELLSRPMEWNTYRAPTDNDRSVDFSWKQAGYHRPTVRVYSVEQEGGTLTCHVGICALYIGRFLDVKAVWTVSPDGRVDVSLHGSGTPASPGCPGLACACSCPGSSGRRSTLPTAPMRAMWTNTGPPGWASTPKAWNPCTRITSSPRKIPLTAAAGM